MFDCAPPLNEITPVRARLPANACDSHCHIFGPAAKFPYIEERPYTPPDASFEKLRALHRKLSISRAVIVQPGCHGFDMSAVLDALDRGQGQYRGVALLAPDVTSEQIKQLDARGVRGARFNFVSHLGGSGWQDVERTAQLIAPYGWHICIHTDKASLPGLLPLLKQLNVPFVMDHMGRVAADEGVDSPIFQALLTLKDHPNAWVKISGIDRVSSSGKRPFDDGRPLVGKLIETMPDRLLWGSDWPHPNVRGDMPDDGELVNVFTELCPDPALQERILVTNPQTLYRFSPINI
ncbi:MAG TPA: amidohydrolase family protein [Eoetvoesiella sp.]